MKAAKRRSCQRWEARGPVVGSSDILRVSIGGIQVVLTQMMRSDHEPGSPRNRRGTRWSASPGRGDLWVDPIALEGPAHHVGR